MKDERVPLLLLPLALGNFAGPLILGHLFDSLGRRKMITGTYAVSALLLVGSATMFRTGALSPAGQNWWFVAIFFIASSAASSAYLTVSEVFPSKFAPSRFRSSMPRNIDRGSRSTAVVFPSDFVRIRTELFWGYLLASGLMLAGAGAEAFLGVDAE